MSVEIDVILPSALVTLVSIPDIAVALPVMFVLAVVKLDCKLVMSDDWDVIVPSADVTRVSRALIAVLFAVALSVTDVRLL